LANQASSFRSAGDKEWRRWPTKNEKFVGLKADVWDGKCRGVKNVGIESARRSPGLRIKYPIKREELVSGSDNRGQNVVNDSHEKRAKGPFSVRNLAVFGTFRRGFDRRFCTRNGQARVVRR